VDGALYGAAMAIVLMIALKAFGVPLARGKRLAFNVLMSIAFFVVYLFLKATGVDDFWAFVVALLAFVALEFGLRAMRPARFSA
jgi:hypothetical protein